MGYDRSVIVACDVSSDQVVSLVEATCDIPGIGGYKVGFRSLGGLDGLAKIVSQIQEVTRGFKPVIYDHQKAGNDIPAMGKEFARMLAEADVQAAILFPFAGPATQKAWTEACQSIGAHQDEGINVLIGGHMTHDQFLASEGGYIADDAPERIYRLAAEMGVRDFVVPGNKVEFVTKYRELLESILGEGQFCLYAPGFVSQGGDISETGRAAGRKWHAIVGSAIYKAEDPTAAAQKMVSQILAAD